MQILFIHQNIPGQFRHLLADLVQMKGVSVWAVGEATRVKENWRKVDPRLNLFGYTFNEKAASFSTLHLKSTETNVRRGLAVAKSLATLKTKGLNPDVVFGHPGWGEMLFVRDVFPNAKIVNYCEFYFNKTGQDFGFDPEFRESPGAEFQVRTQNMTQTQSLLAGDLGISPTEWQRSRYPDALKANIKVAFDGVDTAKVRPNPVATFALDDGRVLSKADEVITFVNRNLEPMRGYHVFARALPELQRRRPNAHVVLVGGTGVSYSRPLASGSYRDLFLNEVAASLDLSRVHFTGRIGYEQYLSLLQVSSAHVYLTYPFVLSWSLVEAMSAGCRVIASRTRPVEEVVSHMENGWLVDFFDREALLDAIDVACTDVELANAMGQRARDMAIERYDLSTVCLPALRDILIEPTSGGLDTAVSFEEPVLR